jgi:predicted DNA-binding transcriptional regulator AlpA
MSNKRNPGTYGGSRVGFLEHEVENWIRQRVRFNSGEPVAPPQPAPEYLRIIPVKEVERRVGFSRVHIWRLERQGKFPERVRLIAAPAPEAAWEHRGVNYVP